MTDHVICVRNVKKDRFGSEPGATYFLDVPASSQKILPRHKAAKKKAWFKQVLKEAETGTDADGTRYGDILVFIHGYNNDQKIVLKRHRIIKKSLRRIGYQGVVISFDWPSADSALNYLEDRTDAKTTAIKLVDDCIRAFTVMQEQGCRINVHLLAHSTGAYVIREAFDDADDRPRVAATSWTVSQVMFIGGDVSAKSMGKGNAKSSSIYRHCIRLTNYSSPFDAALKISNVKRIGVAPRVGRIGLPDSIPSNAVNVDCGPYYKAHEDTIQALGTKSHSWYIGDPVFTRDMLYTIEGDIDRHAISTRQVQEGRLTLHPEG